MAKQNLPDKNQFNNKTIKDYNLETEIGRGNIGVVYRAHHKDVQALKAAFHACPNLQNTSGKECKYCKV